ncbi:integral membrane protein [Streptomyces davaonensis JCM 4913]|uniref:Integral membrane protein n=1 Tax=Streptomyces davaonensis (strain DSM 101723 / JCM 4913 / KCC S-0913 / 768) TaxID=1214101 RepID=K4R9G9_STRDJ|nr:class E sortase [Streptomyces davaonensis]CCK29792.1 integral membrane protein [Streptomyces davaonensis JCM 4913]
MRGPLVVRHGTRRRRALRRRALWTGGELLVTVGLVLLLLVAHQLWWTNREAKAEARRGVATLEREWGDGRYSPTPSAAPQASPSAEQQASPGAPRSPSPQPPPTPDWSQAYAILTIPALDLRVPVAEGISKSGVLNRGYVGHYPRTQQPGHPGNFALAGHRNTHGEPFRRLDRLGDGDEIVVETEEAVYTYAVDQTLAQTSAHDNGVIRAVPRSFVHPGRGYREPGYYITLTTCTPEYTSRYRLVVWGTLLSMRAR